MDLSQKQLEELVVGKPTRARVSFYDQMTLDVAESKKQNRRIYREVCYIKETYPGVTDWVPRKATPADAGRFPDEYRLYQTQKMEVSKGLTVPVSSVPGITPAERQELIDYGIVDLAALAEADTLPPHLVPLKCRAKMTLEALQAMENDSYEESEENHTRSEDTAAARQEIHDTVERPELPARAPEPRSVQSAEGPRPARRINRDQMQAATQGVGVEFDLMVEM